MKVKDLLLFFFFGMVIGFCITFWCISFAKGINKPEEEIANVRWKANHFHLNESNLMDELKAQGVAFPEIVKAQAVLETGHFKSYACLQRNNLFGLRRRDGTYMSFDHWTESVAAYKKYIQKWEVPPSNYYYYLDSLGYAEDKTYVELVKQIVNKSK